MQTKNKYIEEIIKKLSELDPYVVILFGSYAYGSPDAESDIDILVVTKDNFIPKTFKERTQIYLKISKAIRSINRQIAIDLIVHTLPMYKKFIQQDSSFAHEILTQGKILYESDNKTMA